MSSSFEKVIIGSSHDTAEEMFDKKEYSPEVQELIAQKREEFNVLPDIEDRFNTLLEEYGYEQVRTMGALTYPSITEWIDHRFANGRWAKFFPCFVKNNEGKILFCKIQVGENERKASGIKHEAEMLGVLPEGINAPRLEKFVSAEEQGVAMLIAEAIPFSEASVKRSEDWSIENVDDVLRQITILEEHLPSEDGIIVDYLAEAEKLLERAGETVENDVSESIKEVFEDYKSLEKKSVFVHGDLCGKNMMAGKDKTYLVDWELSGKGFKGQDIGKFYLGLHSEHQKYAANVYTHHSDGSVNKENTTALIFGVVVEKLVSLVWRNEHIIKVGKGPDHPDLVGKVRETNGQIREMIASLQQKGLRK